MTRRRWQHGGMGIEDHVPDDFVIPEIPSDRAEFWGAFWDADVSPWDLGGAHPELEARFAETVAGRSALVPGCGRGHDAAWLAGRGWRVTAMDLHGGLEEMVAPRVAASGGRFLRGDVLQHDGGETFDLWWDHTFFCAIPPERRADWGVAAGRLVRAGGELAALVFPIGKPAEEGGPPFGVTTADLAAALGERFEPVCDEVARTAGERKPGAERFARFRRR